MSDTAAKYRDCLGVLGPGNEALCRELAERETRMRANLAARSASPYPGIDPGAIVTKARLRLPPSGWHVSAKGVYKKRIANRVAVLWERDGAIMLRLLDMGVPYVPADGRSKFDSSALAAHVAEDFLSGVGGNYMPLAEGRELARLNGSRPPESPNPNSEESPVKSKSNLRSIIRRSVGIGAPQVAGPLRRISPAPANYQTAPPQSASVAQAVEQALAPIWRSLADLSAQVEGASPAPAPQTRAPTYVDLRDLRRSGQLARRSAPAPIHTGGAYVVRTVPNSHNAGSGRPLKALTVRSAVRRSVGLSYRPPVRLVGRSAHDAIQIEQSKHMAAGYARALRPRPDLVGRTYANPVTGQRYATAEAAAFWTEASRKPGGVPFSTR